MLIINWYILNNQLCGDVLMKDGEKNYHFIQKTIKKFEKNNEYDIVIDINNEIYQLGKCDTFFDKIFLYKKLEHFK